MRDLARRLGPGILLLAITIMAGTIGFTALEGWTPDDALFSTCLVISTLGFVGHYPVTIAGRLLTGGLIAGGVGTFLYVLSVLAHEMTERQAGVRREKRLKKSLESLEKHVIVCGYGRVGQEVVRELRRENTPFAVIEPTETRLQGLIEEGLPAIAGDASQDDCLRRARIDTARGLVVCAGSDAVNVFIVLSARNLREDIHIVARATQEPDEAKLLRAGADRVITPASLGGRRMASLILRPAVVDFLDVLVHSGKLEMWIEEIRVSDHPALAGRTLAEARAAHSSDAVVLAVRRHGGDLAVNPPPATTLGAGDVLIALGTRDALERLARTRA